MGDFDVNRCIRILTATLTKFFYLCNHTCDIFEFGDIKYKVLNAIGDRVLDELFVLDLNENKYFTIDLKINNESLNELTLRRYYNIDNILDSKLNPIDLEINIIEENTPDTNDDLDTIRKITINLMNKNISKLREHTHNNRNMMESVCISAGYLIRISMILLEIAQDVILDTYFALSKESFDDITLLRMRTGIFLNTFLRELCSCNILHTDKNYPYHGFIVDAKSYVRPDKADPNNVYSYETAIKYKFLNLEWVDFRKIWTVLMTE